MGKIVHTNTHWKQTEIVTLRQTKYTLTQKPWKDKEEKESSAQQEDKIMVNVYDTTRNTV